MILVTKKIGERERKKKKKRQQTNQNIETQMASTYYQYIKILKHFIFFFQCQVYNETYLFVLWRTTINFNIRLKCSYNRRITIATYIGCPCALPIKAINAKIKTMRNIATNWFEPSVLHLVLNFFNQYLVSFCWTIVELTLSYTYTVLANTCIGSKSKQLKINLDLENFKAHQRIQIYLLKTSQF